VFSSSWRREIWIFLGRRRFGEKTPDYGGLISLDFLGFSRPNRDFSMGYEDFPRKNFSGPLPPRRARLEREARRPRPYGSAEISMRPVYVDLRFLAILYCPTRPLASLYPEAAGVSGCFLHGRPIFGGAAFFRLDPFVRAPQLTGRNWDDELWTPW
jgi:hypothetical protein